VQEYRYSINEIKEILDSFNLEFLGFLLDHSIKKKYANEFKNDKSQTNLLNWNNFEEKNQNTFREMYQFWTKIKCT